MRRIVVILAIGVLAVGLLGSWSGAELSNEAGAAPSKPLGTKREEFEGSAITLFRTDPGTNPRFEVSWGVMLNNYSVPAGSYDLQVKWLLHVETNTPTGRLFTRPSTQHDFEVVEHITLDVVAGNGGGDSIIKTTTFSLPPVSSNVHYVSRVTPDLSGYVDVGEYASAAQVFLIADRFVWDIPR